jgi:anti-sigma regulatory factor (Ser/Thr protein kinase)
MTLFLVVNSSVWHGGSVGFVHGAVASVIVAAIVLPLTVWGGSRRLAANVVMYGALATIPLIVSTTVDAAFFGAQVFQPIMLTMAVGIPVGFWLGAAAQAVVGDRATTISELRELSLEPDWQAHVELMHRHAAEAAAATFLHGTIQSRLTAAALQLKSAATNNDIVRAEAAVELALSAVALASQTQTEAPQRNPIARLEALAIAWTGIATIDLRVEVTEENDQRYAVAWMLVADAVEEGVTNAIRHGKASHVWVTAHAVDGAIEATITDDGLWKNNPTSTQSRGARGTSVPSSGIGLTLINRISEGNWSAVESSEGTTILLRVRV